MRLFICIEFDNKIIGFLKTVQGELKKAGLKGRFTSEENLHLTLAFIGEYNDPDYVLDAMEESEFTPFPIEISGIGNFDDLFWAGLKDSEELTNYVKRLRKCLSDNKIPFDKKKFKPHVTLVRRGEFAKNRVRFPEYLPKMKMMVKSVTLMKSEFGKNGMIYTKLGEVE